VGVTVAASKPQFIVQLEEVRHSNRFPAPHQRSGYLPVILGSLCFNVNPMAKEIDHIERIKPAIVFDISLSQKLRLMDVVEGQRL
jgi:hypothetical protein